MKTNLSKLRRFGYALAAVGVVTTALVPVFAGSASAAQVSGRLIRMSNATPSATGVSYFVQFTPPTTGAQSLIIDFCSESPIIGGTCTAPTGMSASSATFTAGTGTASWAAGTGSASQVRATRSSGSALGTTQVNFTFNAITNPSTTGTFYARVYTFANTTYGTYASAASPGNYVDYGGFALSTSGVISVSATVQEQLTFCVSNTAPGNGCTSLDTPVAVTLGSGSPVVLGTALATANAYHQVTTNAVSGVSVALKNTSSTTCAGLSRDNGATCGIPSVSVANSNGAATIAASSGQFGLSVANGTGGSGTVSAASPYNTANYAMRTETYGTYGDPISTSSGAVTNVNSTMTYAAAAAANTPAGVYTATHSLIATGTF